MPRRLPPEPPHMGASNGGTNGASTVRPAVAAAKGTVIFLITSLQISVIVSWSRFAWTEFVCTVQSFMGYIIFAALPSDL